MNHRATDIRTPGLLPAPLADWLTRWGPKILLAVLIPMAVYAVVVPVAGP